MSQDAILGYFYISKDYSRFAAAIPVRKSPPSTAYWDILSRPCGTGHNSPT
jgi:hypothetical protein